jgi:hypothetical protein
MVKMAPPFFLTSQLVMAEKALRNVELFYIHIYTTYRGELGTLVAEEMAHYWLRY